ncbi:unnamed protein product [Coffea canephora]|uniref:Iron-binding zinc finger CDGSH type domain-containing protein n=1 Tax=Coffea canephora TaxID=49390 RepID=A0A068UQV3_COFCA|nr:unnamed protein product [Coffea canephora]
MASASVAPAGFSYGRPPFSASEKPRRTVVVRAEAINPASHCLLQQVLAVWDFPLCDGSHVKHNKATGDNVGPLLVKKQ